MNKTRFSTLCMLAILSIVSTLSTGSFGQTELTYTGQKMCKICHNKPAEGKQWTVWKGMKHAHAIAALSTDRALEIAAKAGMKTPPSEAAECLRCHVTGYDVEKKAPPKKIKLADSVQCESCHGPASGHVADGPKLKAGPDHGLDVLAKIVRPDVDTCVKCHNEENPTWDPAKYTLSSGETAGFDFDQAYAKIAHPNPQTRK